MKYLLSWSFFAFLTILKGASSSMIVGNMWQQLLCPSPTIPNARVRIRGRGRFAKIRCLSEFFMIEGDRHLTCIRGSWIGKIPHCIKSGCPSIYIDNGEIISLYNGALLHFVCRPGYISFGNMAMFCDGQKWNDTSPECRVPEPRADHLSCNFERDMCGWSQDSVDDLDWKWTSASLNAFTGGLGAKVDHTFGTPLGHYIHTDSKEFINMRNVARLYSPIFAAPIMTPACVIFYYHMYGPNSGQFNIYLKPDGVPFVLLTPYLSITGFNPDIWQLGFIELDNSISDSKFQVIFEGMGGKSHVCDIAVDDFKIASGDECIDFEIKYKETLTTTPSGNKETLTHSGITDNDIPITTQILNSTTEFHNIIHTQKNGTIAPSSYEPYTDISTITSLYTEPIIKETPIDQINSDLTTSPPKKKIPINVTAEVWTSLPLLTINMTTETTLSRKTLTPTTSEIQTNSNEITKALGGDLTTSVLTTKEDKTEFSSLITTNGNVKRTSENTGPTRFPFDDGSIENVTSSSLGINSLIPLNLTEAVKQQSIEGPNSKSLIAFLAALIVICLTISGFIIYIKHRNPNRREILKEETEDSQNNDKSRKNSKISGNGKPRLSINSYQMLKENNCSAEYDGTPV